MEDFATIEKIEDGNDCCRFCLKRRQNSVLINSFKHEGLSIEKMLFDVSGFKVQSNDPKKICQHCWEQLVVSFQFIQKIREIEKKLRETVNILPKLESENTLIDIYPAVEDPSDFNQSEMEKYIKTSTTFVKESSENSNKSDAIANRLREYHTKKYGRTYSKTTKGKSSKDWVDFELREKKNFDGKSCDFCWEEYPGQVCQCPAVERSPEKGKIEETCQTAAKSRKKVSPIVKESPTIATSSKIAPTQPPADNNIGDLCYICGISLTSRLSWNNHMIRHRAVKEGRKFVCDICGRNFLVRTLLSNHMKNHIDLNLACEHCGKRFRTTHRYTVHLKIHNKERSFVCRFNCGLAFRTSKIRGIHEKIHRPERDYVCPVKDCCAGFNISSGLRDHVKKHHPDYKLPPKGTVLHRKYNKAEKDVRKCYFYSDNLTIVNK